MSTVTWQSQQPRRPVPAGPSEELQSVLDLYPKVTDLLEMLDEYDWTKSDLSWLVANKKGKVQAWANKEIKAAKEDAPEPPE